MDTAPQATAQQELILGIMTPGGNAPGYNSFVKGAVDLAQAHNGRKHTERVRILALRFGIRALLERQETLEDLTALPFKTIESRFSGPGSELGNSRGFIDTVDNDPRGMRTVQDNVSHYRKKFGLKGLIVGGGDGSMLGLLNARNAGGFNFNQVPITIDDDIEGTDVSVGLHSATAELDRIVEGQIADVSSHQRVILIQVMGRDSGQVAFKGGRKADVILIGECPVSNQHIIDRVTDIYSRKHYAVVVVGENFNPEGYTEKNGGTDPSGNTTKGNRVQYLETIIQEGMNGNARHIAQEDHFVRSMDTGSIIRTANPDPFDSRLARRMGADAVYLALSGHLGYMVTRQGGQHIPVPLEQIRGGKRVDPKEYDFKRLQKNRVSLGVRAFVDEHIA